MGRSELEQELYERFLDADLDPSQADYLAHEWASSEEEPK